MSLMKKDFVDYSLIRKYNVPGPRYTGYPTVPYWDAASFSREGWEETVRERFSEGAEEISLYVHLPYCESLCTFCGCNTRITVNHSVELPYIETVLKEWSLYRSYTRQKPVISELHLGGGTPTFFSPENLKLLISGLLSGATLAPGAELGFEGHPANTTKRHLEVLAGLGFRRVSYGIQDFDPGVQQVINRLQSYDDVRRVTEESRAAGYTSVNYDIVYGLPLQTAETIADTIGKVSQLRPDRIAFYSYAHVPWVKPGQRRFTEMDLPDDESKRALYELGRSMLEEAGYREIGMDHFALESDALFRAEQEGTLHRNFMGYTTRHTERLIGLGVSAISDLWSAYAQNAKTVEEYRQIVEQGLLPVFRGHMLDSEDLRYRRHILDIMCRRETRWDDRQTLAEVIDRLKEPESDGLIRIGDYDLKVHEEGKPFLRNICMAFDARMRAGAKKEVQFSKVI